MRFIRIFLLHFQRVFVFKGLAAVWFFTALIDIGLIIFFWSGAAAGKQINGWNYSQLVSYYLFALIAGQLLMPHQEYDIAMLHIQQGGLTGFLLRPFSYIGYLLISEIPWRLLTGSFALLTVWVCFLLFHMHITVSNSPVTYLFAICISILGFLIAFLFKMIIGIIAFWLTEIRGLFEAAEVVTIILMGNLMPLSLYPQWLAAIGYLSPFSYIIYFPVIAWIGKLSLLSSVEVIGMEILWIVILFAIYERMWHAGLKKFSAVGI